MLEYWDGSGSAEVHLKWACAGCTPAISQQVVPSSALTPAWLNQTSTVSPLGRLGFSHFADPAAGHPDYVLAQVGGQNVITSFSYDAYGRVTQKVMPKGNAARTIDANGNLQGSIDTTYATTWAYYAPTATAAPPGVCGGSAVNQAGLLKSKSPHGIAATTFVYDGAGRSLAETNGAGTKCFHYDGEGRLTSQIAPGDAQATTFTYDPAGQTRSATDASGTLTTAYDEAGRVVRASDSFGAESTFAYNAESNLVLRTAAAGPLATATNYNTGYGYNAAGQLTSVTDPAGRNYGFRYDTRGALRSTQYPNGTFSWNEYNPNGSLAALYNRHGTLTGNETSAPADSLSSPLVDYAYTYNLDGQKTQEVRTGGGSLATQTTSYSYDGLGRLSQVTLPDATVRSYTFDLDSNRTAIAENGATVATYSYDPSTTAGVDQLTSVTQSGATRTFTYTADGQTRTRGTDTLDWNGWGQHSGGTFSGTTLSYGFDATGFRRQRTSGSATTRYLSGGLFETDASGSITLTDVEGPGADLAHYAGPPTTATTASFLYYSGHGDLAAEANLTGTRTAAYTYDPFGSPKETTPANQTTERWTGSWDKELDTTSSLIEMGARQYDPVLGRFLSVDAVEAGSCNGYDYACQDPVNMFDLSGTRLLAFESGTGVGCGVACSSKWTPEPVGASTATVAVTVAVAAAGVVFAATDNNDHKAKPDPGGGPDDVKGGHTKGQRPSTSDKHQEGEARRARDQGKTGGPRPPRKTFPRGKWRGK